MTGDGPAFPLDEVQRAAREERIVLEGPRCREILLVHLDTLTRCLDFARDVALALSSGDFMRTVELHDVCDEYGLALPETLASAYGLEAESGWYVKITLQPGEDGMLVFVSLHPAERALHRRGGVVRLVRSP